MRMRERNALAQERPEKPIVRLNDVAERAGCSPATVSRVLNRPGSVNADARMRVEAAVRELGYMRNGAARALRSRKTRIVGTIIPTLNNAIYAQLVEALQRSLGHQGYSLLVTTSEFILDQELSQGRALVERGVEGLVLVGNQHRDALFELLDSQSLPYVTTYTYNPVSGRPSIGFDNKSAMGRIVDFLLDLGHREFAILSGIRQDNDRAAERVEGAVASLKARGIALPADRIVEEPYTIDGGRAAMRRILDAKHHPTAVVCGSDVLAFGALTECANRGIQVPQDISVTGFDNLDFAAFLNPPLTTLQVPAAEMGQRAGEYILARLRGRAHDEHVPLETNLILRRTTAPPRKQPRLSIAS
jgi:LacI family transcriptional regulator